MSAQELQIDKRRELLLHVLHNIISINCGEFATTDYMNIFAIFPSLIADICERANACSMSYNGAHDIIACMLYKNKLDDSTKLSCFANACFGGRLDVAKMLHKIMPRIEYDFFTRVFNYAVMANRFNIVVWLLETFQFPHCQQAIYTNIQLSLSWKNLEMAKFIHNKVGIEYYTNLTMADCNRGIDTVKFICGIISSKEDIALYLRETDFLYRNDDLEIAKCLNDKFGNIHSQSTCYEIFLASCARLKLDSLKWMSNAFDINSLYMRIYLYGPYSKYLEACRTNKDREVAAWFQETFAEF